MGCICRVKKKSLTYRVAENPMRIIDSLRLLASQQTGTVSDPAIEYNFYDFADAINGKDEANNIDGYFQEPVSGTDVTILTGADTNGSSYAVKSIAPSDSASWIRHMVVLPNVYPNRTYKISFDYKRSSLAAPHRAGAFGWTNGFGGGPATTIFRNTDWQYSEIFTKNLTNELIFSLYTTYGTGDPAVAGEGFFFDNLLIREAKPNLYTTLNYLFPEDEVSGVSGITLNGLTQVTHNFNSSGETEPPNIEKRAIRNASTFSSYTGTGYATTNVTGLTIGERYEVSVAVTGTGGFSNWIGVFENINETFNVADDYWEIKTIHFTAMATTVTLRLDVQTAGAWAGLRVINVSDEHRTNFYGDYVGSADFPNSTNMVPNGWSLNGSAVVSVETTNVYRGNTALKVSGSVSNDYIWSDDIFSADIPVGGKARITGRYFVETPAAGQNILFYNSGGTPSTQVLNLDQTDTGRWIMFELEMTRELAAFYDVEIECGAGTVILDDLRIVDATERIETWIEPATSILTNGGFDDATGWDLTTGGTIQNGYATITALGSITITGSNWNPRGVANSINDLKEEIVDGLNYTLRFRARQTVGTGDLQVGIEYDPIFDGPVTADWEYYEVDFIAVPYGTYSRFTMGGRTANDKFDIDDISLVRKNANADRYTAGAYLYANDDNTIPSGGYGQNGYETQNIISTVITDLSTGIGDYVMKIQPSSVVASQYAVIYTGATVGTYYECKALVKVVSGTANIRVYDTVKGFTNIALAVDNSEWVEYSQVVKAESVTFGLLVGHTSSSPVTSEIHFKASVKETDLPILALTPTAYFTPESIDPDVTVDGNALSGNIWEDVSGNGFHATAGGGTFELNIGSTGRQVGWTTSGYLDLPDNAALEFDPATDDATIICRIGDQTAVTASGYLVSKAHATAAQRVFGQYFTAAAVATNGYVGGSQFAMSNGSMPNNALVIAVISGGVLNIWVDGVQTVTNFTIGTTAVLTGQSWNIGGRSDGGYMAAASFTMDMVAICVGSAATEGQRLAIQNSYQVN